MEAALRAWRPPESFTPRSNRSRPGYRSGLTTLSSRRGITMPLKVGIVGMGGIGTTHARCYMDDSLAELVAVCDVIKEKADQAAEKWGVPARYSLAEMLAAHPDLDIVD